MTKLFGSIEAGGTKFLCMVASGPDDIRSEARFPTTTPSETLAQVIQFFQAERARWTEPIEAIGIGSFGPVDLNPASPAYGCITATPKPGWSNTALVAPLRQALGIPVAFDTDVNAAAIGEGRWGAGRGLQNFVYFTIGTGIGGGAVVNGQPVHGLVHPEMGHMRLPHDFNHDPFPGVCPFHADCFEGLACGLAIRNRWGQPAESLPLEHPAWDLEAHYIAQALQNAACVLSPQRIILGGGIMQQAQLFPLIRKWLGILVNKYIASPAFSAGLDAYVVAPELGSRAGGLGALALAMG
jgi:fructokinase